MPNVFPFTALTFDPAIAGPLDTVTAPPYDVIGVEARRQYLAMSPFNVVHLDLAEDDEADSRYARAARLLADWRSRGALVPSEGSTYVGYEMRFRLEGRDRRVRGLMLEMELEDTGGSVVPHERTMLAPVEDRLLLLRATRANLSAVYGTIEGPCTPLSEVLDVTSARPPGQEVTDEQGVSHLTWEVPPDVPVDRWLAKLEVLIADGHHRYATALRYRDEMRQVAGPGPWDRVLTLIVDAAAEEPPVLPFHRIVLEGSPPVEGRLVRDLQEALAELDDEKLVYGMATLERGMIVHRVAELDGEPPTVRELHEQRLDASVPPDALRFVPDAAQAEEAVRSGEAVAAYLLPSTSSETILRAVARGDRLPQKSTYFWPKPRTGLVIRPLEGSPSIPPTRATPPARAPAS